MAWRPPDGGGASTDSWWLQQVLDVGEMTKEFDLPAGARRDWATHVLLLDDSQVRGLTTKTIERQFRNVSRFIHPDRHGQSDASIKAATMCSEAKTILLESVDDIESTPRGHGDDDDAEYQQAVQASVEEALREAASEREFAAQVGAATAKSREIYEHVSTDMACLDEHIRNDVCRRCAVLPDGNCQLRAMVVGMLVMQPRSIEFEESRSLRVAICRWLSQHRDERTCEGGMSWLRLVTVHRQEVKSREQAAPLDFDTYLEDMRDLSKAEPTWGDGQTLGAFVLAFEQPVLLYTMVHP